MIFDFKQRVIWMTSVVLTAVVVLSACSNDDVFDNRRRGYSVVPQKEKQKVMTAGEVLGMIDRVTVILDTIDSDKSNVVYFYFKQPIDHNNPGAGTFQQYCVLHYEHPDSLTVLHTQGYSIAEKKTFRQLDLSRNFGGNYIEVEHRYYKRSEIGDSRNEYEQASYWDNNTAEQSTADLHDIVTALKGTNAFSGKWISSGVSKNGILTSMYAYYYPNEVDVYVPFCAPFCLEQEAPGIGLYTSRQSGKGTTAREKSWIALETYLANPQLQEEVAALYKEDNAATYPIVLRYSLLNIKRIMVYRFMSRMFQKFAYHPISEWESVIPGPFASAQKYYLFASLGKDDYSKKLSELRKVYEIEGDDDDIDDSDYEWETYDDYEEYEYDEDYWDENAPEEANGGRIVPKSLLQEIYHIHAATELGYFLYDWKWLLDGGLIDNSDLNVFNKWQTSKRYNDKYGVTYDGGKLMNSFLQFVQNNRNNEKCRIFFIYGANDPWTGAAIPDPAADDPYVKKFIVPNGLHSGRLNDSSHYTQSDKEYIINTIRKFLTSTL